MATQKLLSLLILDKSGTKSSLDLLNHVEYILPQINKLGLFIKIVPIKPKVFETLRSQGKIKKLTCIIIDDQPYTGEIKQIIHGEFNNMKMMLENQAKIDKQRRIINMNEDDFRDEMISRLGGFEDVETDQEEIPGEGRSRELERKMQEEKERRLGRGMGEQQHFETVAGGRPPPVQDGDGGMVRQPQQQQFRQQGRPSKGEIRIPQAQFGGNEDDDRMARYFEDEIAEDWSA